MFKVDRYQKIVDFTDSYDVTKARKRHWMDGMGQRMDGWISGWMEWDGWSGMDEMRRRRMDGIDGVGWMEWVG